MVEDRKLIHDKGLGMGWLRDHGALKVVALRGKSEGSFDDAPPIPDEVWDKEVAWWNQWRQEEDKRLLERYHLALQAVKEIEARNEAPRRRGRPAYLPSYAEYKRVTSAHWINRISDCAGLDQRELAVRLGFAGEKGKKETDGARILRFVKSGTTGKAGGQNRMPRERVIEIEKAVRKHGWDKRRRGGITTQWSPNPLLNEERFEHWALEVAEMSFEDYKKKCIDIDCAESGLIAFLHAATLVPQRES